MERKIEVAENMTKEFTEYTQLTNIKITFMFNFLIQIKRKYITLNPPNIHGQNIAFDNTSIFLQYRIFTIQCNF